MPITKSAKKSLRVSETKKAQNDQTKIRLSKALKKTDEKNVAATISLIDKAAKLGIFHKNKAARMKSALSKKFGTGKKEDQKAKVKTQNEKAKVKKVIKKTASKSKNK